MRVATMVRRQGDRLYANAAWDRQWEIQPDAARFYSWREPTGALRAMSCEQFLALYPQLGPGALPIAREAE